MKESAIQKKIQDYIKSIGGYVVKVVAAPRAGIPDLLCCIKGKFIAFEVKTESGRVSKLQEYNIKQIKLSGGEAYVVNSVNSVNTILDDIFSKPDVSIK